VRQDVITGPISGHRQHSAKHYSHESADVVWVLILDTAIHALHAWNSRTSNCGRFVGGWLQAIPLPSPYDPVVGPNCEIVDRVA
jgi:hypothetical protein